MWWENIGSGGAEVFNDVLEDEKKFWNLMKEGLNKSSLKLWYASNVVLSDTNPSKEKRIWRIIYSSSDDECSTSQKRNQTRALDKSPIQSTWTIDKFNESTLLRHLDDLPGTNSCMFYVGGGFTVLPYYEEEEHLSSISFLCLG